MSLEIYNEKQKYFTVENLQNQIEIGSVIVVEPQMSFPPPIYISWREQFAFDEMIYNVGFLINGHAYLDFIVLSH